MIAMGQGCLEMKVQVDDRRERITRNYDREESNNYLYNVSSRTREAEQFRVCRVK